MIKYIVKIAVAISFVLVFIQITMAVDPDNVENNNTAQFQEETNQSDIDNLMMDDMMGMGGEDDFMSSLSEELDELQDDLSLQQDVESGEDDARDDFTIGGYIRNELYLNIGQNDDISASDNILWGDYFEFRLKLDWKITSGLLVHAESLFTASYGYWNYYARLDSWGLMSDTDKLDIIDSLNAGDDLRHDLTIDQAYLEFDAWRFTFQAGRMIVGWGLGYFINPTDKINNANLLNPTDQLPGTTVINTNLALWKDSSLLAYIAFEDRSHTTFAFKDSSYLRRIPFGAKLRMNFGGIYIATGFIREVFYNQISQSYTDNNYAFVEYFSDIWIFGFYTEMMFRIPYSSEDTSDMKFDDIFEAMYGIDYIFSQGPELRLEYYHQGRGSKNKKDYSGYDAFTGDKILLAKDYLLFHINKGFWGKLFLNGIVVWNITDMSGAGIPMITYNLYENCEISLGAYIFWGEENTEFDGRLPFVGIDPDDPTTTITQYIDLVQHMIFLRAKVSF